MQGFKYWKDWLHPVATVMGAWGGFPKPPEAFLALTKYELFQWFLVFVLAYQGGAEEDIRQALIITVIFYLVTKLLDLRDVSPQHHGMLPAPPISNADAQQIALEDAAKVQAAQAAATQAAQAAAAQATTKAEAQAEAFFGGYYI